MFELASRFAAPVKFDGADKKEKERLLFLELTQSEYN